MTVNTSAAGHRFGHLTVAYGDERARKFVCYCTCSRQVHVALEDLRDGTINSCGCMPPPPEFWVRYAELRTRQRREIQFYMATRR